MSDSDIRFEQLQQLAQDTTQAQRAAVLEALDVLTMHGASVRDLHRSVLDCDEVIR